MKILYTATCNWTTPWETFETNPEYPGLMFWHQDTVTPELYQELIARHGQPDIVVSSAHPYYTDTNVEWHYLPEDLATIAYGMQQNGVKPDSDTEFCFNFMLNKERINRQLLVKLVEWFKLTSYTYTLNPGMNSLRLDDVIFKDFEHLSDEYTELKNFLPHAFEIPGRYFDMGNNNSKSNVDRWNQGLYKLFSKSAVSLISECLDYEPIMCYSEKSLFAMQGLTFPIWVGGHQSARLWQQHGFDVFDDVIDHSYQDCDTVIERCTRAIKDNMRILSDLEYARELRQQHHKRLVENKNKVFDSVHKNFMENWNSFPEHVQKPLKSMIDHYGTRNPAFNWVYYNENNPINTKKV
jgi:hypothetical protein